jgi:hypothetical protein
MQNAPFVRGVYRKGFLALLALTKYFKSALDSHGNASKNLLHNFSLSDYGKRYKPIFHVPGVYNPDGEIPDHPFLTGKSGTGPV